MRKIVAVEFMSLDGVVEAPNEWHFPYFNDEMGEAVGGQMAGADALLLGRVTYEGFAAAWPERGDEEPGAAQINRMQKYVVTSTLATADWQNSAILKGDLAEEMARIKALPGKNIWISGSIRLVQSLLAQGLLDELHLLIHPILVGKGQKMFGDGEQLPLEVVESKIFQNGVVSAVYRPAGNEEK
ncbi:MAG TPA: dihydrofolate reductase family protein [Mycobacteriales bacterium]|nr:dihydrofolate reductase family protein [Mycobacteriales bacterium]